MHLKLIYRCIVGASCTFAKWSADGIYQVLIRHLSNIDPMTLHQGIEILRLEHNQPSSKPMEGQVAIMFQ